MPDHDGTELSCPHCERTFGRREHLTRHLRRHSGARPHVCPQCDKSFSRRDTLKRHVNGHGADVMADFTQQHARIRACAPCARAKQRCDGQQPCNTCQAKNRTGDCRYINPAENTPSLASRAPSIPVQRDISTDLDWTADIHDAPSYDALDVSIDPALPGWDTLFTLDADTPFWSSVLMDEHTESTPSHSRSILEMPSVEEQDVLFAEDYRHVDPVSEATYDRILEFAGSHALGMRERRAQCPPLACFAVYVQLYFEHFHPRMPFLHIPTFSVSVENWTCVLAVACIGSHYSAHSCHTQHWHWLAQVVRCLLQTELSTIKNMHLPGHAQSLLAVYNCLLIGPSREDLLFFQLHRNNLIVHCRRSLPPAGSLFRGQTHVNTTGGTWSHWIQEEAKRRLIYFTWVHECFENVFYILPPLLDSTELHLSLPCSEAMWQASSEMQWQELCRTDSARNVDAMDAPSVHLAIDNIARTGVVPPALGESAGLIVPLTCFMQHTKIRNLIEVTNPSAAPQQLPSSADAPLNNLLTRYETAMTAILNLALPTSQLATDSTNVSRTLQILVFTPMPLLTQAAHWETTTAKSADARSQLRTLLMANPIRARRVMLQAGRLFHTLRNATPLSHIDPFCLLISVLYIQTFISSVTNPPRTEQRSSKIYRVDQCLDNTETREWIEGRGDDLQLHMSGVGILETERSNTRLLKEAARILDVSSGRSCLATGLSRLLSAQASGYIPRLPPPDDSLP